MTQTPPTFDPFQGPLSDRQGTLRVAAGQTLSPQELRSLEWAAAGVVGAWPNEP
jgi:simple sugar transport system substrate-binding protein